MILITYFFSDCARALNSSYGGSFRFSLSASTGFRGGPWSPWCLVVVAGRSGLLSGIGCIHRDEFPIFLQFFEVLEVARCRE